MERIANYWRSSLGGKIIIILVSLIAICSLGTFALFIIDAGGASGAPTPTADLMSIINTAQAGVFQGFTQTALALPTQTFTVTTIPTKTITPIPPATNTVVPTKTPSPTKPPLPTAVPPTSPSTGFDNNGDGKVTCADFQTQAAAQQAYDAGYTQLDGNDNDGLACESLP